jgi:hypothetical protein
MDIPCRSSWTGAHANFQAREYDAGASLTKSKTNVETRSQLEDVQRKFLNFFKISLKVDALNINEII